MKILKNYKFGNRLLISLDTELPDNFRNNSKLLIDGNIYHDAIIPMSSDSYSRKEVSVELKNDLDLVGKQVHIIQ